MFEELVQATHVTQYVRWREPSKLQPFSLTSNTGLSLGSLTLQISYIKLLFGSMCSRQHCLKELDHGNFGPFIPACVPEMMVTGVQFLSTSFL